ncbi:MAG: acyltransferase family protein [Methylococcales bacterium]|nr:acyltransferase family protein [Methylococcales bacterium]MDD5753184.1 acyltransferase family protein [Methylococcales bacterium]
MTQNQHLNYRPDIDGLRAVAILLVLIFHGFPRFIKGGFIGVDIFFVISGYLITSIILKSQAQGEFNLVDFYSRRIKRIFPALLVVLIFCLTFGWFSLLADEYQALGKHVAAGAVYISNLVLQSEAGYFDTDAEFKPLLHLWSLGIEEQFYLIFPLLLMLTARFKSNALIIITLSLLSSFTLNVLLIDQNPTGVFFFPQTRAWELLIGSFVAHINLYQRQRFDDLLAKLPFSKNHNAPNILAWLSLSLIVGAWIGLDNTKIIFPNGWALLPTLGAAGLILAGEQAWFNRKVLASKAAVWLGLISYPLYLWHWPLLALMRTIEMDKPKSYLRLFALFLSVLLAWLTYQLVEKKLRFWNHKGTTVGLLASLLFVGSVGYYIQQHAGYPERFNYAKNWKEGELGQAPWKAKWLRQKECTDKFGEYVFCLVQNIEKPMSVVLLGDSHANHFYPALLKNNYFKNDNILNLSGSGCSPFFDTLTDKCHESMHKALNFVLATESIHTVIVSNRDKLIIDGLNDAKLPHNKFKKLNVDKENTAFLFQQTMRETFQQLLAAHKRVIFITDIPELEFNPADCITRPWRISKNSVKTPCATPREQVEKNHQIYLDLVTPVLNEFPEIIIWDTVPAFCDADYCWAIKDQKMLYRDDNHLSETGAIYLGEYLNKKYPLLDHK